MFLFLYCYKYIYGKDVLNLLGDIYIYESENEIAQSCLTLCHPMDYSLPGSSVHGIFLGHFPNPGIKPTYPVFSALVGRFFTTEPPEKPVLF